MTLRRNSNPKELTFWGIHKHLKYTVLVQSARYILVNIQTTHSMYRTHQWYQCISLHRGSVVHHWHQVYHSDRFQLWYPQGCGEAALMEEQFFLQRMGCFQSGSRVGWNCSGLDFHWESTTEYHGFQGQYSRVYRELCRPELQCQSQYLSWPQCCCWYRWYHLGLSQHLKSDSEII